MDNDTFSVCPRCGSVLGLGFAARAIGLSFVEPEKFDHWAFIDEDIAKAGVRKYLPSRAQYYRSYLCRSCKLYLVDYSTIYSRHEAEDLLRSLQDQG